ncbi:hypothetical protein EV648_12257 [Kribbella sp. VKM Ac-2568]|nr:hypothetical protein EV648_12257 [Kribbella sp. VKM Ac-2568]
MGSKQVHPNHVDAAYGVTAQAEHRQCEADLLDCHRCGHRAMDSK